MERAIKDIEYIREKLMEMFGVPKSIMDAKGIPKVSVSKNCFSYYIRGWIKDLEHDKGNI